MSNYIIIKTKKSKLIIKIPNNNDTTILEISSFLIVSILKKENLESIKDSLEKAYDFDFETGEIVSEINIDH